MKVFIGTSGWSYEHWKGIFYPKEIKANQYLSYYSNVFKTVEINNTFYNLPGEEIFKRWKKQVPLGFVFSVKANRYLTHVRRLEVERKSVDLFFKRVLLLEDFLGPILFQLPPNLNKSKVLSGFLNLIPKEFKIVFEFRNKDWYTEDIFDLLKKRKIIFCIHDHSQAPSPLWVTSDKVYMRMHGPSGSYTGRYSKKELEALSEKVLGLKEKVSEVYCYFNNDAKGYAVENARNLLKVINSKSRGALE